MVVLEVLIPARRKVPDVHPERLRTERRAGAHEAPVPDRLHLVHPLHGHVSHCRLLGAPGRTGTLCISPAIDNLKEECCRTNLLCQVPRRRASPPGVAFLESAFALIDILDAELQAERTISIRWYDALVHLEVAEHGLRMNELAEPDPRQQERPDARRRPHGGGRPRAARAAGGRPSRRAGLHHADGARGAASGARHPPPRDPGALRPAPRTAATSTPSRARSRACATTCGRCARAASAAERTTTLAPITTP